MQTLVKILDLLGQEQEPEETVDPGSLKLKLEDTEDWDKGTWSSLGGSLSTLASDYF